MDYGLCSPVSTTNISYPIQRNVVTTMQNNSMPTDTVSFSGVPKTDEKKSHTGLWVLGGLAVAAGLGIIFRKNVAKFLGMETSKSLKSLLEKRENYSWSELEKYFKENHANVKDYEKSFVIKKKIDAPKNENDALAIGYFVKGQKDPVITKVINYKKLDNALIKQFEGNDSFSWK